jgi:hypothetical protein
MEFQPQSLALRAMVNVDILEFFSLRATLQRGQFNIIPRSSSFIAGAFGQPKIIARIA